MTMNMMTAMVVVLVAIMCGYATALVFNGIQKHVIDQRTEQLLHVDPYRDERGHARTGWCYNGWEYKKCTRQYPRTYVNGSLPC